MKSEVVKRIIKNTVVTFVKGAAAGFVFQIGADLAKDLYKKAKEVRPYRRIEVKQKQIYVSSKIPQQTKQSELSPIFGNPVAANAFAKAMNGEVIPYVGTVSAPNVEIKSVPDPKIINRKRARLTRELRQSKLQNQESIEGGFGQRSKR